MTTHIIQLYCSISRNTHFFDRIACNVWWAFIFSLSIMSNWRIFPFSMLKFISLTTHCKLLNDFSVPNEFLSEGSDKICLLLVTKLIQLQHKMKEIIHLSSALPEPAPFYTSTISEKEQITLSCNQSWG